MGSHIKHIGVFTSGGDSPGMNACIRAVVRAACFHKIKISGIRRGYQGMIDGDIVELQARSVSNIIQRGGTILKTARCEAFTKSEGRKSAHEKLQKAGIDALIAIGGDGTFRGAQHFGDEFKIPVVGVPGTIDNDLAGTDFTLGFDTAVNTAVEAVDRIKDTAASHDRLFFIEVMGRDAGYIALWTALAGGAEAVLLPEEKTDINALADLLKLGGDRQKSSSIVIVCEGDDAGSAEQIAAHVKSIYNGFDTRVTVLGHVQRGGSPTAFDRILGSRLGIASVEALIAGEYGKMVGVISNKIVFSPFSQATKQHVPMDPDLLRYARILSI